MSCLSCSVTSFQSHLGWKLIVSFTCLWTTWISVIQVLKVSGTELCIQREGTIYFYNGRMYIHYYLSLSLCSLAFYPLLTMLIELSITSLHLSIPEIGLSRKYRSLCCGSSSPLDSVNQKLPFVPRLDTASVSIFILRYGYIQFRKNKSQHNLILKIQTEWKPIEGFLRDIC